MIHNSSLHDFSDFLIANEFIAKAICIFENAKHKLRISYQEIDAQCIDYHTDDYRTIAISAYSWISKSEIIKARILTLLGKNKTVFARKTIVKRIDKNAANAFLDSHHLNGYVNAYYKYGLFYDAELVAVMTFNKARKMTMEENEFISYEIVRFASKLGINVVGGLSKLFQHFIREHGAVHVMTYTDYDWGIPNGFLKIGFEIEKITMQKPFLIHKTSFKRINEKRIENIELENYNKIETGKNYRLIWKKTRID